ncbi:MAG: ATP-binding cassette domain-containing protein, partial [Lachnospiraceae bacterium]|nr:ATP-binding cassette domain-containing protein [Lachnospiraceae bacterium]
MIRFENVSKEFTTKKEKVEAVKDVSFEIQDGEIFGIIGFSGAGKSTLVRLINLLERPTSGAVYFNDVELTGISKQKLREIRHRIGMVFQQFNLLEQKNVLDNVCFPLEITGVPKNEARKKARELLALVGLSEKEKAYPSKLSGGQKQRVGIARALATDPDVLLCDEATSALDPITTKSILALLKEINEKLGVTIVVITHEMAVVEQSCDRVAVLCDGRVEEIGTVKEVFLNPKSETARRLVMPGDIKSETQDGKVLRIVFDGQSSYE